MSWSTLLYTKSRTLFSIFVLILIIGAQTYQTIPKEADPDITIPLIIIKLHYEGISPEDSSALLVKPLEQALKGLDNLKEVTSTGYYGGANIVLKFTAGSAVAQALTDVREKIDNERAKLPVAADDPVIEEINLSKLPIVNITLSGDIPEKSLQHIATTLQNKLEGLPSVLEAPLAGSQDEVVEIILDPEKLEQYQLDLTELGSYVARNNTVVAAGTLNLSHGSFPIKVPGLLKSRTDILNLPLIAHNDTVVQLKDIATVHRTFKDKTSFAAVNGKPAIVLSVIKKTGENIITTIEQVKKIVSTEQKNWPDHVSVHYLQDNSVTIQEMLSDLQNSVLFAVLLVMIVVIALLGIRSGLLVGVSIPGSFLLGITVLAAMSLTINTVVLFSLILAVGMLVDGTIVVTEYAEEQMHKGISRKEAYLAAVDRMALPILSSTLTTLAAFFPLLFWPDIVGEFMKFMPITLLATLSASLLMALVFIPALGIHFGKPNDNNQSFEWITARYRHLLTFCVPRAPKIIGMTFIMLLITWGLYIAFNTGIEFFPDVEPEYGQVFVRARGNLSYSQQKNLVQQVETMILRHQDELQSIFTESGKINLGHAPPDTIGRIQLQFAPWNKRRPARLIVRDILKETQVIGGLFVEFSLSQAGPPTGKDLQIQFSSPDQKTLREIALKLLHVLRQEEYLYNFEDTLPLPGIEWELTIDRAAALKFGTDIMSIGRVINLLTHGTRFSSYMPENSDEEIDIVARLPKESRTLTQLQNLRIKTKRGLIPLSQLTSLRAVPKTGMIKRREGQYILLLKADSHLNKAATVTKVNQVLSEYKLPQEVTYTFKGEEEEQQAAAAFLKRAFSLALFIIAIILTTQFNSFYLAFLILSTIVLSTVGVLLGLLLMQQTFSIVMTGIGIIALAGIVVNNNIVLIDTYQYNLQQGQTTLDAAINAGCQRLRAVLLTTVTTILGLLPMALQFNIDFLARHITIGAPSAQWWVQLATAIVFGLGFATLLTLFVTPCALVMPEYLYSLWKKPLTISQKRR